MPRPWPTERAVRGRTAVRAFYLVTTGQETYNGGAAARIFQVDGHELPLVLTKQKAKKKTDPTRKMLKTTQPTLVLLPLLYILPLV